VILKRNCTGFCIGQPFSTRVPREIVGDIYIVTWMPKAVLGNGSINTFP
jgi:hypothetical protein